MPSEGDYEIRGQFQEAPVTSALSSNPDCLSEKAARPGHTGLQPGNTDVVEKRTGRRPGCSGVVKESWQEEAMSGWRIKVSTPGREDGRSKTNTWIVAALDQGQAVELLMNNGHASKENAMEILGRISTEELQSLGMANGEAVLATDDP